MNRKSSTSLLLVAVLLSCAQLLSACATAPARTTSTDHDVSAQSSALPPAGDAGQ